MVNLLYIFYILHFKFFKNIIWKKCICLIIAFEGQQNDLSEKINSFLHVKQLIIGGSDWLRLFFLLSSEDQMLMALAFQVPAED